MECAVSGLIFCGPGVHYLSALLVHSFVRALKWARFVSSFVLFLLCTLNFGMLGFCSSERFANILLFFPVYCCFCFLPATYCVYFHASYLCLQFWTSKAWLDFCWYWSVVLQCEQVVVVCLRVQPAETINERLFWNNSVQRPFWHAVLLADVYSTAWWFEWITAVFLGEVVSNAWLVLTVVYSCCWGRLFGELNYLVSTFFIFEISVPAWSAT